MKAESFIFVTAPSKKRGYNLNLSVWRVDNNIPEYVGDIDVDTRSYMGERGEVSSFLAKTYGFKMRDSYFIDPSENVTITEVN